MTAVSELLAEVRRAGASLIPLPDGRLKWRAPSPLPEPLLDRLRSAKQDLLRALSDKPDTDGHPGELAAEELKARIENDGEAAEPKWSEPWPQRRGRIENRDGAFLHFCKICGTWGAFGFDVRFLAGQHGRWYCSQHRPDKWHPDRKSTSHLVEGLTRLDRDNPPAL